MSLGRYSNNIDVNEKRRNPENIRQDVPNARMNRNLNVDVVLPLERVAIKNADSLNSGRCESTTVPQIGGAWQNLRVICELSASNMRNTLK